ncbi:hypothetical protein LOK49_Contig258G00002 [Camellia lanceoleosa]|nr:hypothetical protein LOK49_Contig258G00002 [Camellia lanceoleosa]
MAKVGLRRRQWLLVLLAEGVVLVGSGLAMLASSSSEEQKGNKKPMVAPGIEGPLISLGKILRMTQLVISATIVLRVEDEQLGLMGFDRNWVSFVVLFFLKLAVVRSCWSNNKNMYI